MAYEGIERYRSARNDFVSVKELDPSNMQASQGLQRVSDHVSLEKEQPKPPAPPTVTQAPVTVTPAPTQQTAAPKPSAEPAPATTEAVNLEDVEKVKNEGNTLFKQQKVAEAYE